MLHRHAQTVAKGVDTAEPLPHAGEQLDGLAALHQEVPVQRHALGAALLDHGIHISQQAVHLVLPAEGVGLLPELRGGIAQTGDEGIVLHIRGAQGLIKVVQQGDDGSFAHRYLLFDGRKSGPRAAFFVCYSPV